MKNYLDLKDIYTLFETVQKSEIFEDQKMMADLVPKYNISEIIKMYEKKKDSPDFVLKDFILENFIVSESVKDEMKLQKKALAIDEHIEKLWDELSRVASENKGTLLMLPKPYIVPGGRFNEFFYWDSYFIMLGLQCSGRLQMMKNIVENCSYLIENFGFVPNASRSYFLSRSQPPYFSMMLDLIFETTNDKNVYIKYFETMQKEYEFWMAGSEETDNGCAVKRAVKTKSGDILNRYYDDENKPRPESYMIDVKDAKTSGNAEFFRNIRAACESGWDFSSRWFKDGETIQNIHTLDLAQVDLNCLLWHLESTLSKTAKLKGDLELEKKYGDYAVKRKFNIQKYFWDHEEGIYKDFDFQNNKISPSEHIAALYPLFFGLSTKRQSEYVAENLVNKFLKPGGLITTTNESGQQWDFPNAWAPYQWIGFIAMKNYNFNDIASRIKNNWCSNVERVYENTGKLMEKYNAMDIHSIAGGGEYPNQDGFGWTNGVYSKLKRSK